MTPNELYQKVFTEGKTIQVIPILYADLVSLVNNNQLIPGENYRIIDFVSKYTGTSAGGATFTSAEHPFDIVVTALTTNILSENCSVLASANDNGYFSNQGFPTWKIKYTLIPNQLIFGDNYPSTGGKGFIYWMEDEKGNSAPYDFKNLLIDGKYTFHWTLLKQDNTLEEHDASLNSQVRNNVIDFIKSPDDQGSTDGKWNLNAVSLHSMTNHIISHPKLYSNQIRGTEVFLTGGSVWGNTVCADWVSITPTTTEYLTNDIVRNHINCSSLNITSTLSAIRNTTIEGRVNSFSQQLSLDRDIDACTLKCFGSSHEVEASTFPNIVSGESVDATITLSNTPTIEWLTSTKLNIHTAAWDSGQSKYVWTDKSITL